MKKITLLILISGVLVFFSMCNKEKEETPEIQNSEITSLSEFQEKYITESQFFTINSEVKDTIIGEKGTKFIFWPYFRTTDNDDVSGIVDIEIKEIFSKKEILLSNKSTVSNDRVLESDGVFYVKATQNGNTIRCFPVLLEVPTESIDTDMKVFYGDGGENINWILDNSSDSISYNTTPPQSYLSYVRNDTLGWINIDRFLNIDPKTNIEIIFNNNPSLDNTALYIVFNSYNSVIRIQKDTNDKFLISDLPIDEDVSLLGFTFANNKVYSSISSFSITDNLIMNIDFQEISESELINQIEDL